jgi:hypothetical protein
MGGANGLVVPDRSLAQILVARRGARALRRRQLDGLEARCGGAGLGSSGGAGGMGTRRARTCASADARQSPMPARCPGVGTMKSAEEPGGPRRRASRREQRRRRRLDWRALVVARGYFASRGARGGGRRARGGGGAGGLVRRRL